MQSRFKIGNAQTIGEREVQSNYFSTIDYSDSVFAVLADGTIDHANGRRAAILSVETSIAEWKKKIVEHSYYNFFEELSSLINQKIKDTIYFGKTPKVSLSMTYRDKNDLFYYSIGNNQLFLYNGYDFLLLKERNGHINVNSSDITGLISSGVHQSCNEVDLIQILSRNTHQFEKAQEIIEGINEKHKKTAGNSTIVLMEGGL